MWFFDSTLSFVTIVSYLFSVGQAIITVPDPPAHATVDVVGSDAIEVSFSPPLSDGGSPITSYTVEWDTAAGTPEVQEISTLLNLKANEVQTITTMADDVNEVQVITTSATPYGEVQSITVSPFPGESSLDPMLSYSLKLDTVSSGGSIEYSGQISATADEEGSRNSLSEILGAMRNVDSLPTVTKSFMNSDGGYTYLVTFPPSMKNVPQMEIYLSDLPVSVSTVENANLLDGYFRLEYSNEISGPIPSDANEQEMQDALESLNSVGSVQVTRSNSDNQNGYSWTIEFTSEMNGGNLDDLLVHSDDLTSTNNAIDGAVAKLDSGGSDGSFIQGNFSIVFGNYTTSEIPCNASAADIKASLEIMDIIGSVDVSRSKPSGVGGYTWTVSFLEDSVGTHRGDIQQFQTLSNLTNAAKGIIPSIKVAELRKGTFQEVQRIRVSAGGLSVNPGSSFKLRFNGEITSSILALPLGGSSCLGDTAAKQIITTSTEDTTSEGGDGSVSPLTTFVISYDEFNTNHISANDGSCADQALIIANELMLLTPLKEVSVSGNDSGADDGGCVWIVSLLSVTGNPELLKVTVFHGDLIAGPGTSVVVGDFPKIIRDRVSVTQPHEFLGDVNLIQSELSKLTTIGIVTVSPESEFPDQFGQCSWTVTFESNAGNLPSIEVAKNDTYTFSSSATLEGGDIVTIEDNVVTGTSKKIGGDFTLEHNGQRTSYLPFNVTADEMRSALSMLSSVGDVQVQRDGPDVNSCFKWLVTFTGRVGPLPLLTADFSDLVGTSPLITVTRATSGVKPSFDSKDYGSALITDPRFPLLIDGLKQGISYYVRVTAANALGSSNSTFTTPPMGIPQPRAPSKPSKVLLKPRDGSSLEVVIEEPKQLGGGTLSGYVVDYSTTPFEQERQQISLTCAPVPEVQTITTSAADINEIQYLIIDSSYEGNGIIVEEQRVECDATGGEFGLLFIDEIIYIPSNATENEVKSLFESHSSVVSASVTFSNDTESACSRGGSTFFVSFDELVGVSGNLPQMVTQTKNLSGARRVDVSTVVDGDSPTSGTFTLSFRGKTSQAIDASLPPDLLVDLIDSELELLDTIEAGGVIVHHFILAHSGPEKIFSIEFIGAGVGGDIPPLSFDPDDKKVHGSTADVFVVSGYTEYLTRNGIDKVIASPGNVLSGHFKLRLRGHETGEIVYNASADQMKASLEALPNVGTVHVSLSAPSKERAYTWTITFLSSPGYYPELTRNVDTLQPVNFLTTSVVGDSSANITVNTIQDGDDHLSGQFKLAYNDGVMEKKTAPLESFISANDMKDEIEKLLNIGEVDVSRTEIVNGYLWDIDFIGCKLKNSINICNDGDLPLITATNLSLTGCTDISLNISETTRGNGPGTCPGLQDGLCRHIRSFSGHFPISHIIDGLKSGLPYFVQVQYWTEYGYGRRQLATPQFLIPSHNPPGPPPAPFLVESSATSITIGWETPTVDGGKKISGYELWMGDLNGEDSFLVYDGVGDTQQMEYRITTRDQGPLNQVVESGRQYQFAVRAVNNCDVGDINTLCYGDFSEPQVFTVRDPRPPQPPSAPQRDSRSSLNSESAASIVVSWSRPVDNGGSPITGYIIYIKHPDDSINSFSVNTESTMWSFGSLVMGEIYRIYVVAVNSAGRSGNSPMLTTIAAVYPGLGNNVKLIDVKKAYQPDIVDVKENSITVKWNQPDLLSSGGSAITGYKIYMYEGYSGVVEDEIQQILLSHSSDVLQGTFTLSYRGLETKDIPTNASSTEVKYALENLETINAVDVSLLTNGWQVTFLSEAGNLPLMMATTGRLIGPPDKDVKIIEYISGNDATLVLHTSDASVRKSHTVGSLVTGTQYSFRIVPVNALGDGILSLASDVAIAHAGASAVQTTASGGALSRGIAGTIHEVQVVYFSSSDCHTDRLHLSFQNSPYTENLCDAEASVFEEALNKILVIGNVHVDRKELLTLNGSPGYEWRVTFMSDTGNVPLLKVDITKVQYGKDSMDKTGHEARYVSEFLSGYLNEFIIEPKKASGAVVWDYTPLLHDRDVFFTELWISDHSILDGSHEWYADGGVARYNPVRLETQVITVPNEVGSFVLTMDTSPTEEKGRMGGFVAVTDTLTGNMTQKDLQQALSALGNIDEVIVSSISTINSTVYTITFTKVYGELPLMVPSSPSILVTRNADQIGVTEIQSVIISSDKAFLHEVQTVSVLSAKESFWLSYGGSNFTRAFNCSFVNQTEANGLVGTLKQELEEMFPLKVVIAPVVSGSGVTGDPWTYTVTFLEPVGPQPLLKSNNADVEEVQRGFSPLSGTFVLEYGNVYSKNIPFDASAEGIKHALEDLTTIEEVEVKKFSELTGFRWDISFTRALGNLPNINAYTNVFEVQKIITVGGFPTPLGGTFRLFYETEETPPLSFDASASEMKNAIESLPSIERVDVQRTYFGNGQYEWTVTIRIPEVPVPFSVDGSNISGTLDDIKVHIDVKSQFPSLHPIDGGHTDISVEEKVPGLPSYTGTYNAKDTGSYSLVVQQLVKGGLRSWYYDNQWLTSNPSLERVDPSPNFNWGSGSITPHGKDFISVRWWGKVKPKTSETYTFYVVADDGAKLYIDHKLVVDCWECNGSEMNGSLELVEGSYHDIKVEYKEETGSAFIHIYWSSNSVEKEKIPSDQLFYSTHISGSPFLTAVRPGAADYPHSTIVSVSDQDYRHAFAGDPTYFFIEARDSNGNKKLFENGLGDTTDQFTVAFIGQNGIYSGKVTYIEGGTFRVDYTLLKSGNYTVHVKSGGTDIYCGMGETNKCSPFSLVVEPGYTDPNLCEAESGYTHLDSLVEGGAGEKGLIFVQAKDTFGNNRLVGGDEVTVQFIKSDNRNLRYRGYVKDNKNGSYEITYSIPTSGQYEVEILLNQGSVKLCRGASKPFWNQRSYDGITVYHAPYYCRNEANNETLAIIHHDLHAHSTTIADEGINGLSNTIVGKMTGFTIEARDKFGNIRSGTSTNKIHSKGDGSSDVFLVTFLGPEGYKVTSSSAVQEISCSDSSIAGYFRLKFGNNISDELPHDVSTGTMQVALTMMNNPIAEVKVHREVHNGNFKWTVTFLSHLEEWSQSPLTVLPGRDGSATISKLLSIKKIATNGLYPINYSLWKTGIYEVKIITPGSDNAVSGSTYTLDVHDAQIDTSSTVAYGEGLSSAVAGQQSSFFIQAKDKRQTEIQVITTNVHIIDHIHEIQQVQILSINGESFSLIFRGKSTPLLYVGTTTLEEIKVYLEDLPTITAIDIHSSGSSVIRSGDKLDIEFKADQGPLSMISSSGPEKILKIIEGEAPFRRERQVIKCNADSGSIELGYSSAMGTLIFHFNDTLPVLEGQLENLIGGEVSLSDMVNSTGTLCSPSGSEWFVDFDVRMGDVLPLHVVSSSLTNGALKIFGNGEEHQGAINGMYPIMGSFSISLHGESTSPIPVGASADELRRSLEGLSSIGSVSVTKDYIGICQDSAGQNMEPGTTCGSEAWIVEFSTPERGCMPSKWDNCPPTIGDIDLLAVDTSSIYHVPGKIQQQKRPSMEVHEAQKGSTGNNRSSDDDLESIHVSLEHNIETGVGIGMNDIFEINCTRSEGNKLDTNGGGGYFQIEFADTNVYVPTNTSTADMASTLRSGLGAECKDLEIVSYESSHSFEIR